MKMIKSEYHWIVSNEEDNSFMTSEMNSDRLWKVVLRRPGMARDVFALWNSAANTAIPGFVTGELTSGTIIKRKIESSKI